MLDKRFMPILKHAADKKRRNESQRKYRKRKHEENVAKGPEEQPLLIKFNIPSIISVKKTKKIIAKRF